MSGWLEVVKSLSQRPRLKDLCSRCNGAGRVTILLCHVRDDEELVVCPVCAGTGLSVTPHPGAVRKRSFHTLSGPILIAEEPTGVMIDARPCGPYDNRGVGSLTKLQTVELRQTLNKWFPIELSDDDIIEFTQLYHDNLNSADQKSAGFAIKAMRDALQSLFEKTGA